jgi:hypothetical protein
MGLGELGLGLGAEQQGGRQGLGAMRESRAREEGSSLAGLWADPRARPWDEARSREHDGQVSRR